MVSLHADCFRSSVVLVVRGGEDGRGWEGCVCVSGVSIVFFVIEGSQHSCGGIEV